MRAAKLKILAMIAGQGVMYSSPLPAWTPGSYPAAPARMHTRGFTVDTSDRNDVIAFWHAVYKASEGYEKRIDWRGDYNGRDGTVSPAFVEDVERRLNYMRAMCGVPAEVRVNTGATVFVQAGDAFTPAASTTKAAAAQAGALMLVRNYNPESGVNPAMNHNPPNTCIGWSPQAWNANAYGNLAFGIYGPGAIDQYMLEELPRDVIASSWNILVGHRRWCLYPPATDFATGDQPGESVARPPTNVLYVMQNDGELATLPTESFAAFPPAGFCPSPLNTRFWSVSMVGADFSGATVTVTASDGAATAVSQVSADSSFGDPSLIWEVDSQTASKVVNVDRGYQVQISNFTVDGAPKSLIYQTTFINPDQLTSNQSIRGPSLARSNKQTTYMFVPPAGAEAIRITSYTKTVEQLKLDAETAGGSNIIDRTDGSYPLVVSARKYDGFGISGEKFFRLTFPVAYDLVLRGVPDQMFEIDRDLIPEKGALLTFKYRRGFMTRTSVLSVEASADGGVTWELLGAPIRGESDTLTDVSPTTTGRTIPVSSTPVRVRFRYHHISGAIHTNEANPQQPTGIFIDDIATIKCKSLVPRRTLTLPPSATRYRFSSASAGTPLRKGAWWGLRMSTRIGGNWFPPGPVKQVVVSGP